MKPETEHQIEEYKLEVIQRTLDTLDVAQKKSVEFHSVEGILAVAQQYGELYDRLSGVEPDEERKAIGFAFVPEDEGEDYE